MARPADAYMLRRHGHSQWRFWRRWLGLVLALVGGGALLAGVLALSWRLYTGGGRMRRINSYVVNGVKALELSTSARKLLPPGGPDGSVERAALLAAQVEYNQRVHTSLSSAKFKSDAKMKQRRRLMCATFTTSSAQSLDLLHANMRQLGGLCDWAVVFYKAPLAEAVQEFRENVTKTLTAVRLVHMETAADRVQLAKRYAVTEQQMQGLERFNTAAYPKPLLFLGLLPLLDRYERVWLLDDDVSLDGFQLEAFLEIADCAFWPASPPLLVQPLLRPFSKLYPFLSENEWRAEEVRSGTPLLMVGTGFIEVQAPIMDASFFSWFLRFLVVPMVAPLHVMGADWGFDDLFCTAAANFQFHAGGGRERLKDLAPACALVVGGSTMRHLNRAVLKAAVGRGEKWYLNHEMLALVTSTFPTLFHKGFLSLLASPINATGRILHRRFAGPLDAKCLAQRRRGG